MIERSLLAASRKQVEGAEQGNDQPEQGAGPTVHVCVSRVASVAELYRISAEVRGVRWPFENGARVLQRGESMRYHCHWVRLVCNFLSLNDACGCAFPRKVDR